MKTQSLKIKLPIKLMMKHALCQSLNNLTLPRPTTMLRETRRATAKLLPKAPKSTTTSNSKFATSETADGRTTTSRQKSRRDSTGRPRRSSVWPTGRRPTSGASRAWSSSWSRATSCSSRAKATTSTKTTTTWPRWWRFSAKCPKTLRRRAGCRSGSLTRPVTCWRSAGCSTGRWRKCWWRSTGLSSRRQRRWRTSCCQC